MLKFVKGLFVAACFIVGTTEVCIASGDMTVIFDQPADCESIAGWELSWEPTASASDKPGASAFGASIPNDNSKFTCGLGAETVLNIVGIGSNRFWIRAVGNQAATFSEYSNFLDSNVPFAPPVLRSVDAIL